MKKVGIIGGSGYTGGELIRLVLHHPHWNWILCTVAPDQEHQCTIPIQIYWAVEHRILQQPLTQMSMWYSSVWGMVNRLGFGKKSIF